MVEALRNSTPVCRTQGRRTRRAEPRPAGAVDRAPTIGLILVVAFLLLLVVFRSVVIARLIR
jgi:hypothetical protein